MDSKGIFFYFPSCNTWGNLNEIVAIDYDNTNIDHIFIVWSNSLMIELHKGTEEYVNFMKAINERFTLINKDQV